jgi:acetyl esterase/lipase
MKKFILLILFTMILSVTGTSQHSIILPLWKDHIPNQIPNHKKEAENLREPGLIWIENVQFPTIEVLLPAKRSANGKAVLICPGGGYEGLAYDWEGTDIAKLLNSKGIAGIVLKYRLPDSESFTDQSVVPLQDAQRALRMIRYHAKEWNIESDKIGVMGFSAGGHLASTLGTHFTMKTNTRSDAIDALSARPDFMILIYPVISMKKIITHEGSRNELLGEGPSLKLIDEYSNELHVKSNTPPTFIVHATDDTSVPVENSIGFYLALKQKGIPVEMHIYPDGGHGFSLALDNKYLNTWPQRLFDWLDRIK